MTVENTVLLETQGSRGSVRRCRDDTVTHDTSAQVKMSHPYHLASLSQDHKKIENWTELATKNVSRFEESRTREE